MRFVNKIFEKHGEKMSIKMNLEVFYEFTYHTFVFLLSWFIENFTRLLGIYTTWLPGILSFVFL